MFGSDLNLNGSLSPEQLRKVDAYIANGSSNIEYDLA
jgi:hypothetical protein